MKTELSKLTILPLSKLERGAFVEKAKSEILSGDFNPLQIEVVLKGIEETIKAIRSDEQIRYAVMTELEKHGKTALVYGAEITKSERKTWNYECTGDSVIATLKAKVTAMTDEIKEREKLLQAIPEGGIVNPDTGEVIKRAAYTVTEVLTIKIK